MVGDLLVSGEKALLSWMFLKVDNYKICVQEWGRCWKY